MTDNTLFSTLTMNPQSLHLDAKISTREPKSRPDAGVVVFEHRARNQHGDVVAVARRSALMMRTPA